METTKLKLLREKYIFGTITKEEFQEYLLLINKQDRKKKRYVVPRQGVRRQE